LFASGRFTKENYLKRRERIPSPLIRLALRNALSKTANVRRKVTGVTHGATDRCLAVIRNEAS
jgi:hypothetical protein